MRRLFGGQELSERLAAVGMERGIRETEALRVGSRDALAARLQTQPAGADSDKLRIEVAKLQRENNKLRQWLGNFGIHMT